MINVKNLDKSTCQIYNFINKVHKNIGGGNERCENMRAGKPNDVFVSIKKREERMYEEKISERTSLYSNGSNDAYRMWRKFRRHNRKLC